MCELGKYQDAQGSTVACKSCTRGSEYQNEEGKAACKGTDCKAGHYGKVSPTDVDATKTLPDCALCPKGQFSGKGEPECSKCPTGQISKVAGSKQCSNCPVNMTSFLGTSACVCAAGRYHDMCANSTQDRTCSNPTKNASSSTCIPCPPNVRCDAPGAVLNQLDIKVGFWRLDNLSKQAFECPVPQACNATAGGKVPSNHSGDEKCALGHQGTLCMSCSDGWARSGSKTLCTKCDVTWLSVLSSLGVGILFIVGFVGLLFINRKYPSGALRPLLNAWQQLSVILQFDSDWPDALKFLAAALQSINLDVPLAGPVCLGVPFNFYYRLLFAVLATLVVIAVPWLVYVIRLKRGNSTAEQLNRLYSQALGDTVIIVLIVHPPISGLAIQIFRCQKFESPQQQISMLVSDYSIACLDDAWTGMAVFAVAIMVFFSFGMPILFARILWKRNHKLHFNEVEQLALDIVKEQETKSTGKGDVADGYSEEDVGAANTTSSIVPIVVGDIDANTVDANDAEVVSAMLKTLRSDDMTAKNKRAMVATIMARSVHGGGETKTASGDTPAGLPSPERVCDVERTQKLFGILYETYRTEMYYYEAIQMVFKVLLWSSMAMFDKGTVFAALCGRRGNRGLVCQLVSTTTGTSTH